MTESSRRHRRQARRIRLFEFAFFQFRDGAGGLFAFRIVADRSGLHEFDAAFLQLGGGFGDAAINKFTRGVDFPETDKTSFDFHVFLFLVVWEGRVPARPDTRERVLF